VIKEPLTLAQAVLVVDCLRATGVLWFTGLRRSQRLRRIAKLCAQRKHRQLVVISRCCVPPALRAGIGHDWPPTGSIELMFQTFSTIRKVAELPE
jgi:hypothetical protein